MGKKSDFYYDITALHREVTGSCFIVVVHYPDGRKTNFLVDCGLFQESEYTHFNAEQFPFKCEDIEFTLITHNHADHMGRLPMLAKGGFEEKIYATEATKVLMVPAIQNSFQIMMEDTKKKKEKPWYDEADVQNVFSNIQGCKLENVVYLNKNIKVTFFDNGHLIGSAMILVQISYPGYNDFNLLFSGDYKPHNVFKQVRALPTWVKELPLTFVTESTYGYMETSQLHCHFEDDVTKLTKEGKNLLIFVFAQQRAQEILLMLKNMQDTGRLDKKIPIYLDGNLSHIYTKMYLNYDFGINDDKRNFLPENFMYVTKENRNEILYSGGQKIILTTSGMADHGPAQIYVPALVERNDYVFYFTGYTSEKTLGYKLQHPEEEMVEIQGQKLKVKAKIFWTNEVSSHAKADELEGLISSCNVKLLLINHGQRAVQMQFAERIEDKNLAKRVEVMGEHTIRVDSIGRVKVMGSKLYTTQARTTNCEVRKKKNKPKLFVHRIGFRR